MSEELPVIEFENYRITNINFKVYNSLDEIKQLALNHGSIKASAGVNDDFSQASLKLENTIIDEKNLRVITVEITGQFTIHDQEEDKVKNYLQVNGTAILMPYLRAIVSILSSLDNEEAVILPTINTKNFREI